MTTTTTTTPAPASSSSGFTILGDRVTWHAIVGVLAMAAGAVTAVVNQAASLHLPNAVSAGLAVAGGAIVALDRLALSIEGAGSTSTTVQPAQSIPKSVVDQIFGQGYQKAKADLEPAMKSLLEQLEAATTPPPAPASAATTAAGAETRVVTKAPPPPAN